MAEHTELISAIKEKGERVMKVSEVQDVLKTDKDLIDKSVRAYVSYIRYYNEHELTYLFQLKELNVGEVANAFGLFFVPKMKELKGTDTSCFRGADQKVDMNSIEYIDKNKKKQKEAAKEVYHLESLQFGRKTKRREEEVKERRKLEGEREKKKGKNGEMKKNRSRSEKRNAKRETFQKEWDDLAKEVRLMKKLKRGSLRSDTVYRQDNGEGVRPRARLQHMMIYGLTSRALIAIAILCHCGNCKLVVRCRTASGGLITRTYNYRRMPGIKQIKSTEKWAAAWAQARRAK